MNELYSDNLEETRANLEKRFIQQQLSVLIAEPNAEKRDKCATITRNLFRNARVVTCSNSGDFSRLIKDNDFSFILTAYRFSSTDAIRILSEIDPKKCLIIEEMSICERKNVEDAGYFCVYPWFSYKDFREQCIGLYIGWLRGSINDV